MNEDEKKLWDTVVLALVASPMCDTERPETTATRIIERRRMFFDQGIGADLTGPKKPTKPAISVIVDGDVNAEVLQRLDAFVKTEILGDT